MIMQKSLSRKHFFILSYFAYASIYIARLNLTIASPVMEEQDLLTSTQIGAMGGAFFLCYSAGQLLNGFLGDLFLPGKMVTAGLLLTALGNILIGFLPPPGVILVLWGVNGFAQSMLWGPLLRELAARFPGKNQAEAASCLVSSVGVGSVLGILIAAAAISFQDVRFAFLLPGLIAALAGGAVCFFFRAPCVHTKTSLAPCGVSVANLCGDPAPAPRKAVPVPKDRDWDICLGCGFCAKACPTGAMDPKTLLWDDGKCISCMSCVAHCPVGALGFNSSALAARLTENFSARREVETFV